MTNKGQKYLSGQAAKMSDEIKNLHLMNLRLNNEIRRLQSIQMQMIGSTFFKALSYWFIKWRKFRKS